MDNMSILDQIYRKGVELAEVSATLNSISPALSLHSKLRTRKLVLEAEVRDLEQKRLATVPYKALAMAGTIPSKGHSIDVNGSCNMGCC